MSISFTCPHCKKAYKVKDEWAGKKATCSGCQKKIAIPRPTPAPAAADLEALAAAALADEPAPPPEETASQAETPAEPAIITFACPQCDEQVQMPMDMAGKKAPCPSCRRIVRVPLPVKQEPKDWRKVETRGPAMAKKPDQPALAGAWGSATAASTVSRETLKEVGAIPVVRQPLTMRQKANRVTILIGSVLFVAAAAWWGWAFMRQDQQEKNLAMALELAKGDGVRPTLKAEVFRAAGVYYTRAEQALSARDQFGNAIKELQATGQASAETDALRIELALSLIDLGSMDNIEVRDEKRLSWDKEVAPRIRGVLGDIQNPEARAEAVRIVGRKLIQTNHADEVDKLTNAADYLDICRLKGVAGLTLYAHGEKEKALAAVEMALQVYENPPAKVQLAEASIENPEASPPPPEQPPMPPTKQPLPAALVALVVATDQTAKARLPKAIQAGALAAYAEGQALADEQPIEKLAALANQASSLEKIRLFTALAAVALDKKQPEAAKPLLLLLGELVQDKAPFADAEKLAVIEAKADEDLGRANLSWILLRATRLCNQADMPEEIVQRLAFAIPNASVRGLAQLEMFKRRLAAADKAADPDAVKVVGADQSLPRGLAWEAFARHNTRFAGVAETVKVVEGIQPEAHRPLGLVGVALTIQGKDR